MSNYSLDDFDFVHVMIYDVHTSPRGQMVARRRLDGIARTGLGVYGGVCYVGIQNQPPNHEDFTENNHYGNKNLQPILETLIPATSSENFKYKIGQVMCRLENMDGSTDISTPRTALEIQLQRLQKELGLSLKSAFEMEFIIRHSQSKEYFGHVNKWLSTQVLDENTEVIQDMIAELRKKGINIDTIQTEYGAGQFEVTLDIGTGLETPDKTAHFKSSVRTFLKSRGLEASFMTAPDPDLDGCSNGFHLNHSLWTADGKNAFLDVDQPNKLSELGQHWLAGLIEHAPAMTAFANPTLNCYRRIGAPWAPTYSNWGLHNRLATFRLKLEKGDNIYIENRLPTSACNPYLVLASMIVAGLEGVKRKLPLPKPLDHSVLLPKNLENALNILENNSAMTSELNNTIKYFAYSKRIYELEPFKKFEDLTEEERLVTEKEFYFYNA